MRAQATARDERSDPRFRFLRRGAQKFRGRSLRCVFRTRPIPRQSAAWRLAEDLAQQSPDVANSRVARKNAGNFANSAFFAKARLENIREFSSFQLNSLRGRAGN